MVYYIAKHKEHYYDCNDSKPGQSPGRRIGRFHFDQCYLLGNPVNNDVSEILQTYVLTNGLAQGRYSFATAIGLLQSVMSLILIYTSNYVANKLSGVGLF